MVTPRPTVTGFVTALVRAELERGGDARRSAAAERIMKRIHQDLGRLIGPAAFDVLLARALVLARREHPALAGIAAGQGGTLAGLDDAADDNVALQEGAIAIVHQFLELLVSLIGEELAIRLLRDLGPAAAEEEEK